MKLHPWKFQKLCSPWKFHGLYSRLVEIPQLRILDTSSKKEMKMITRKIFDEKNQKCQESICILIKAAFLSLL